MRDTNALVNSAVVALPPRSPVRILSTFKVSSSAVRMRVANWGRADVLQHHGGGQHDGGGIRDALTGDVGCGAVHGFEDGRVGADVGARRHA
jgi:hypothetical protein